MSARKRLSLGVLVLLAWAGVSAPAWAGVFIGVGIPGPCYRPYRGPRVFVGLPPVVVAPAPPPVVVVPAPPAVVVAPAYAVPAPAPAYVVQPAAPVAVLPPAPVPVK
jgi:hypothetical protein